MHTATRFAATALLCLTSSIIFASDDSAHIRGPNYDGIDDTSEIALPWSAGGPTVLWRRPIGQGYSGFVINGNRAYTQIQRREGQMLICLNLEDGTTVWETRYNWPWQMDGEWPGPYATPTYSDGRVFFAGALGLVGCADADTGDLIWSRNIIKEFSSKGVHFGYACTPLVVDGKVFVPTGSKDCAIIALNSSDGSTAWKAGSDRASYTPTIPVTFQGKTQIVSYLAIATYGSDPETGTTLWYNLWGSGYSPHGTWPLYREPYLFRTHPFRRGCRVDRITSTNNTFSLEPVWINKEICADFFSAVLAGDQIYGYDVRTPQADRDGKTRGEFVCIDFETGTNRWRTDKPGHCSVIVSDDKLILLNENGVLILAEVNANAYVELGRWPILPGENCWTMPTIRRNFLLARNQKEALCIYLGSSPPTPAQGSARNSRQDADHWLDKYASQSLWMPDWHNLLAWFTACCIGVILPSWSLSSLILPRSRAHQVPHLALILICVLGIIGTRTFSAILGRFIFTWPTALFACLLWIQVYAFVADKAGGLRRMILSRIFLLLFAGICFYFWHICGRMFLLGGWGFLTGFLPAVAIMQPAARRIAEGKETAKAFILLLASFTVYFWSSAAILVWKAGMETSLNAF